MSSFGVIYLIVLPSVGQRLSVGVSFFEPIFANRLFAIIQMANTFKTQYNYCGSGLSY